jgi:quinol monooxygenase YgiN
MIIVAGHLTVSTSDRDRFVVDCAAAVTAARGTEGCLDFAISADTLDPQRVNVFERWESRDALRRFRGEGPDADTNRRILAAEIAEYEVH